MLPIGHPARVPPVVLFAMAKARPIQPTNIHMAHCVRKRALYCDLDSGGGGGSVLARSGVFLKLTPEQYGRLRRDIKVYSNPWSGDQALEDLHNVP
jgi:hypothetical protein